MDGTTLGVEEEFQVIDRGTGALVPRSDDLLPVARRHLGGDVTAELNRCQIEVASPICTDLAEVRAALTRARVALDDAGAEIGCGILAVGTHPWSSWRDQEVEDGSPRFREMADRYQRVARQQVICGCHVHVGIQEPDRRIAVMTRLRPWMPVLLALSANSPFWEGDDTGYDSYRVEIWARWPTAGLPPHLEDGGQYHDVVGRLRDAGAIEDATQLYWYLRPSDHYPTLEIRVMDVGMTVDDAVCVAGLSRALVRAALRELDAGEPAAEVPTEVLDAALWRAARYGLGERLVSPTSLTDEPAAEVVDELLGKVGPELDELGDRDEVTGLVERILVDGNGAARQRAARLAA